MSLETRFRPTMYFSFLLTGTSTVAFSRVSTVTSQIVWVSSMPFTMFSATHFTFLRILSEGVAPHPSCYDKSLPVPKGSTVNIT